MGLPGFASSGSLAATGDDETRSCDIRSRFDSKFAQSLCIHESDSACASEAALGKAKRFWNLPAVSAKAGQYDESLLS
jgi:hypothetical protein